MDTGVGGKEVMKEAIESRVSKLTKTQFASLLILPDSRVFLPLISGSTILVSYACLLHLFFTDTISIVTSFYMSHLFRSDQVSLYRKKRNQWK